MFISFYFENNEIGGQVEGNVIRASSEEPYPDNTKVRLTFYKE